MENIPLRILLADDDEGDRLIFGEAMGELELNLKVQTVNNGMQLIEHLTKSTILPHLVFLDLNMPRKNGLECLKEIRSNERFAAISIAIYSTSASEKDIEETFLNGANVYIKKPNNFATLKQLLHKAVKAYYLHSQVSSDRKIFLLSI
ncbi:response regulator [Flavobacterium sp.]|uniref:response regulator n=1 Tax=Flavobacterium sp. TaxID=239 RepID=UPI00286D3506|nr:response regulator [Flavobacterium sp.]